MMDAMATLNAKTDEEMSAADDDALLFQIDR